MLRTVNKTNGGDVINSLWLEGLVKIGWPSRKSKEVIFDSRCAWKDRANQRKNWRQKIPGRGYDPPPPPKRAWKPEGRSKLGTVGERRLIWIRGKRIVLEISKVGRGKPMEGLVNQGKGFAYYFNCKGKPLKCFRR